MGHQNDGIVAQKCEKLSMKGSGDSGACKAWQSQNVRAVQFLLRGVQNTNVDTNGQFDDQMWSAVQSFQMAEDIYQDKSFLSTAWQKLLRKSTIIQGDSNDAVVAAKELLRDRFSREVKNMDNNFGKDLKQQVVLFQQEAGLSSRVDEGVIGPATWTALFSNCK